MFAAFKQTFVVWFAVFIISLIVGQLNATPNATLTWNPIEIWWITLPTFVVGVELFLIAIKKRPMVQDHVAVGILVGLGTGLMWLGQHHLDIFYGLLAVVIFFTTYAFFLLRTLQTSATFTVREPVVRAKEHVSEDSGQDDEEEQIRFCGKKARYTFADVDGMNDLKHQLLQFGKEAVLPAAQARKRLGRDGRNGALLHGAPGNGKTFVAEALAGSLGIPFISASFAEFASQWVNQTTERVVQAFDDAVRQAPCILLLDEVDAILVDRSSIRQDESETSKTVTAILKKLESIRGKGVVIIAATNYLDRLDGAGIRDMRFDLKIEIPNPDAAGRLGLLRRNLPKAARVDESVLRQAADHFAGFSVARIKAIARAADDRFRRDGRVITLTTLLQSLRNVQGGANADLREAVPALSDLQLPSLAREQIDQLTKMMSDIEGIERKGGKIPAGAVFYGPPGTGKTITAKALAKATGWTFIPTSGHDLMRTDDAMDKILARASDLRPAIVFIDEADDILADRDLSPHTKMSTNKLLGLMDGSGQRPPDVIFITATNKPELIDEAAQRRVPIKIPFALPGAEEVQAVVSRWLGTLVVKSTTGLTAEAIVPLLVGKSVADINSVLQQAINRAATAEHPLCLEDVTKALENISFR